MPSPAPSRASGSFSISFGLLNVPVSIFTGTEEIRVKRTQWTRDGDKVGNETRVKLDEGYGRPVSRDEIVKRYDTGSGLVDLADDEIDALSTTVPGVADILAVVPFGVLSQGTYVPNGQVWQVRASKLGSGRAAKPNPGGQKAFALLLAALKAEASFALIRFGKGGTVYHAALLPTGDLVGLYADDEVREDVFLPEVPLADDEIALARQLVRSAKVRTHEAPLIENELIEKIKVYAATKITGEVAEKTATEVPASTVDIMSLLQASVDAARVSA